MLWSSKPFYSMRIPYLNPQEFSYPEVSLIEERVMLVRDSDGSSFKHFFEYFLSSKLVLMY